VEPKLAWVKNQLFDLKSIAEKCREIEKQHAFGIE